MDYGQIVPNQIVPLIKVKKTFLLGDNVKRNVSRDVKSSHKIYAVTCTSNDHVDSTKNLRLNNSRS